MKRNIIGLACSLLCVFSISLVAPVCAFGETTRELLQQKGFDDPWIDSLNHRGEPRVYSGDELKFIGQTVGGQYAGQVYLGGDGRLWYWDIFNQSVIDPGGPGDKFYNAPMQPEDYRSVSQGFMLTFSSENQTRTAVLDGRSFADVTFRGEYPIAKVSLGDNSIPVKVELDCLSPFCPTNSRDSGFPGVIFSYRLTNTTDKTITLSIGGWLENATYRTGRQQKSSTINTTRTPLAGATGVVLSATGGGPAADAGSMAIAYMGSGGKLAEKPPASWAPAVKAAAQSPIPEGAGVVQSSDHTLAPGESKELRFVLTWHFPFGHLGTLYPGEISRRGHQRNYYSKSFDDAGAVAQEIIRRQNELIDTTWLWTNTWYNSSLPYWFLDRTFLNASTLATTAAVRLHDADDSKLDGRPYFWEGVYLGRGTCTHVTHYEQAFGRLFPDAARDQRTVTDFHAAWDDKLGYVRYRAEAGEGSHFGLPHAIDGHAGTILRTYREHTTSADDSFLRSVWPRVKRATNFMIDQDAGRGFFADKVPADAVNSSPDGILQGPQYHTLDKYWNGVIPWHCGLYMAALRATAAMASDMGDESFASECQRIADSGGEKLAASNFNRKFGYFVHIPDRSAGYLVNINRGCHVDQVMGDYWTSQVGLKRVLPQSETRSALKKLFDNNFYSRIADYRKRALISCVRFYCDDDEPGFIICTFPHGGAKEAVPPSTEGWDALVVGYFSECMTGFTYQAAAHMIAEGMVDEGLALCRAIHDRYAESPLDRNPFNEIEYGNHYTRAMASYGAFIAATGFEYHGPRGHLGFAPRIRPDDFRSAFTAAQGWGAIAQQRTTQKQTQTIVVHHGRVGLQSLAFQLAPDHNPSRVVVRLADRQLDAQFTIEEDRVLVELPERITVAAGESLSIAVQ